MPNILKISYKTQSHSLPNLQVLVLVMTMLGMGTMFLAILLGAGMLVCMLALLIPMLAVMGIVAGETDYTIDEHWLTKTVRPLLSRQPNVTAFRWSDVASYKTGTDMNRSLQQYEYLEIYFKGFITWQITDQKDQNSFLAFKNEFVKAIEQYNAIQLVDNKKTIDTVPHQPAVTPITSQPPFHPLIERKKTFYETVWAKVFFWVLLIFTIVLLGFLSFNPQYTSITIGFRLLFVLLPGLGYLYWRVYMKK